MGRLRDDRSGVWLGSGGFSRGPKLQESLPGQTADPRQSGAEPPVLRQALANPNLKRGHGVVAHRGQMQSNADYNHWPGESSYNLAN